MKQLFRSRKFRQGSLATGLVAVVTALVVVLNLIASAVTDRYGLTVDLTSGQLFTITDTTKEYLADLNEDVTIYVLDKEEVFSGQGDYYLQAVEVLKKYVQCSDHLSLEFVDLTANPTFAQNYPSLQLSSSSILVTCGDKARDITPYDLYDIESSVYGQSYVTASCAEQTLTSAVLAVTSGEMQRIGVIGGHNEEDISAFTELLEKNNYEVTEIDISTTGIDADCAAVIIAAPQRDFTEEELQRLDEFLENGGAYGKTLLFFAASEQTETPTLDTFLAEWGVAVGDGMVYETDSGRYYPQNPYIALVDYAETTYAKEAMDQDMAALTGYARPLEVLSNGQSTQAVTTLLEFADSAGIVLDEDTIQDPTGDTIPYMVLSQRAQTETLTSSQVLVCGSSAFISSDFLSSPNYANSSYTLNLVAALTGHTDTVTIESKELSAGTMDLTYLQAIVFGLLLTVVLPLVVLISGLIIWVRRRHR